MPNPRFLKIAKRGMNKNLPPEKKQLKKQPKLIQILERDENGKPKLTLSELEKTAVNTPTQEDYDTLIQIYECGGWNWASGNLPQGINYWRINKEKTCINAQNKFGFGTTGIDFKEKKIILTQEFYDSQNPKITPKMINEINQWFEQNG